MTVYLASHRSVLHDLVCPPCQLASAWLPACFPSLLAVVGCLQLLAAARWDVSDSTLT